MITTSDTVANTLYLIYDGDCVLCRNSAQAIKIKKTVGHLEIINARVSHPLVTEALNKGYDLNEGILVLYNNKYYYGVDAVHLLALIGSQSDIFNKINHFLFKHKLLASCFYPVFKLGRNIILFFRGIPQIQQPPQKPLIEKILGDQIQLIPPVLQDQYSSKPYSNDALLLKGQMNIFISRAFQILSPLLRLVGAPVPYSGENIPVTVEFISNEKTNKILMRRTFFYSDKPPYCFSSSVIHIKNNIIIELIRFRFAIKLIYTLDNNKINLNDGGYVFCLGKWLIPLPIGFLIGKFHIFEEAVTEDEFIMHVSMHHFLLGKIFQYDGHFKIEKL